MRSVWCANNAVVGECPLCSSSSSLLRTSVVMSRLRTTAALSERFHHIIAHTKNSYKHSVNGDKVTSKMQPVQSSTLMTNFLSYTQYLCTLHLRWLYSIIQLWQQRFWPRIWRMKNEHYFMYLYAARASSGCDKPMVKQSITTNRQLQVFWLITQAVMSLCPHEQKTHDSACRNGVLET